MWVESSVDVANPNSLIVLLMNFDVLESYCKSSLSVKDVIFTSPNSAKVFTVATEESTYAVVANLVLLSERL